MAIKRSFWILIIGVLYVGMVGAESCGKKALNQIDKAEMAIDQARAADAPEHAPSEFQSAEDHLGKAKDLYDKYRFKKSEEEAVVSENDARAALEKALAEKARIEEEAAKEAELARLAAEKNRDSLENQDLSPEDEAAQVLKDVHFGYDSAELSSEAKSTLNENANFLLQHPSISVKIEGHCDERGSSEYNLALGSKRAKAVFEYMKDRGIDSSRMETISYGEDIPLDPGKTEQAYARNRRAHFAVIN